MLDDSKTDNPTNRKITIFMSFLLIVIFLMIGLWSYYTFQRNVGSTTKTSEGLTNNCWSYSFSLNNIKYDNNTLSFDLENKKYSEARIEKITVVSNKIEKSANFNVLIPGQKRTIVIENIIIKDQFYAYADNCIDQGKIYKIL